MVRGAFIYKVVMLDVLTSTIQPPKAARQQPWTLRFKKHKTTTILLVQPTQPFESIKEELLSSITASGKVDINGIKLPSDPNDIILGVPVDKNDISQGWVQLEMQPGKGEERSGKSNTIFNESPMGAGLKDGSMLAFKFEGEKEDWDVIMPSYDEEGAN